MLPHLLTLLTLSIGHSSFFIIPFKPEQSETLKAATVSIVNHYFADSHWRTRFFVQSEKPDYELEDIMSDVIIESKDALPLDINTNTFPDRFCKVFFLDSFKSLLNIDSKTKTPHSYFSNFCRYRLIVLRLTDKSKIYYEEMFDIFERFYLEYSLVNVNILIEPIKDTVLLYTYLPFGRHHCKPPYFPIKVDEFDVERSLFPNIEMHYKHKGINLFSCTLRIAVLEFAPIIFFNNKSLTGIEGNIVSTLAEVRNFKLNITKLNLEEENSLSIAENMVIFNTIFYF